MIKHDQKCLTTLAIDLATVLASCNVVALLRVLLEFQQIVIFFVAVQRWDTGLWRLLFAPLVRLSKVNRVSSSTPPLAVLHAEIAACECEKVFPILCEFSLLPGSIRGHGWGG